MKKEENNLTTSEKLLFEETIGFNDIINNKYDEKLKKFILFLNMKKGE